MARTVNERLADAAIDHAHDLHQYSNGFVRRIIALLNRADSDLVAQLQAALDRLPPESFTVERLESLLGEVRSLNLAAYREVERELTAELRPLAEAEAQYLGDLYKAVLPQQVTATVGVAAINAEQAYVSALSRPFQGRLLREWASTIEQGRMARIRDAVRIGYTESQTTSEIVRRVRGTRAKRYSDGIIEIDRRHAEAIVRTAIGHVAGTAQDRFIESNSELVKAVKWLSTLDARTSSPCRLRDGALYTLEHKPVGHKLPWGAGPQRLHWNCRSTSSPVLKSFRELGIDVDDEAPGTRASMDGQVPEDTVYGSWLRKQSAARQDEILGPVRGGLMRRGGLTLDKMATDKGRWLSITELRERNAAAFRRAGLS